MHDPSCGGRATSAGRAPTPHRSPMSRDRIEALTRLVKRGNTIPLRSWLDLIEHLEEQTAEIVELLAESRTHREAHAAELEAHGLGASAAILRSPPVGAVQVDHTVPIARAA